MGPTSATSSATCATRVGTSKHNCSRGHKWPRVSPNSLREVNNVVNDVANNFNSNLELVSFKLSSALTEEQRVELAVEELCYML
jgi:hypothetical protein